MSEPTNEEPFMICTVCGWFLVDILQLDGAQAFEGCLAHPIDTQAGNNHLLCASYSSNALLTSPLQGRHYYSSSINETVKTLAHIHSAGGKGWNSDLWWSQSQTVATAKSQSHHLPCGGSHTGKLKTMELKAMQPLQRNMSETYMQGYVHKTCPSQGPNILVNVAVTTEECDDNHIKHAQWSVNLHSIWVVLFICFSVCLKYFIANHSWA